MNHIGVELPQEQEMQGQWEELCLFLTARSQTDLVRKTSSVHPCTLADRLRLLKTPTRSSLSNFPPLGTLIQFTAKYEAMDDLHHYVVVQFNNNHRNIPLNDEHPCVVISASNSLDPERQHIVAQHQDRWKSLQPPVHLDGTLGILVSFPDGRPPLKIIHKDMLESDPFSNTCESSLMPDDNEIEREIDSLPVTHLFLFDFDDTLMHSPEEDVGRKEYIEETGLSYPHKGWWGRPESLLPPMRVFPGPAFRDFVAHRGRAGSKTIILTGRIERMRSAILQVLQTYELEFDELICKKGYVETCDFKVSEIRNLLLQYNQVTKIKLWDDNVENLARFYDLARSLKKRVDIEIIQAPTLLPPMSMKEKPFTWEGRAHLKGMASYFDSVGMEPTHSFQIHVKVGIDFLVSNWKHVCVEENWIDFHFITGCYAFGLKRNIDLWFVALNSMTSGECMNRFAVDLEKKGIRSVITDDQLVIRLVFSQFHPIVFHVKFLIVRETGAKPSTMSNEEFLKSLDENEKDVREIVEERAVQKLVNERAQVDKNFPQKLRTVLEAILQMYRRANEPYPKLHSLVQLILYLNEEEPSELTEDSFTLNFIKKLSTLTPTDIHQSTDDGFSLDLTFNDLEILLGLVKKVDRILSNHEYSLCWKWMYDIFFKKI